MSPGKTFTSLATTSSTGRTFTTPPNNTSTSLIANAYLSSASTTSARPPGRTSLAITSSTGGASTLPPGRTSISLAATSSTGGVFILPSDRTSTPMATAAFPSIGEVFTLSPGGIPASLVPTTLSTGSVFIRPPGSTSTSLAATAVTSSTRAASTLPPAVAPALLYLLTAPRTAGVLVPAYSGTSTSLTATAFTSSASKTTARPPGGTSTAVTSSTIGASTLPPGRTSISLPATSSTGGVFILPSDRTSTSMATTAFPSIVEVFTLPPGGIPTSSVATTLSTGSVFIRPPGSTSTSLAATAVTSSTKTTSTLPPAVAPTLRHLLAASRTPGVLVPTYSGTSTSTAPIDLPASSRSICFPPGRWASPFKATVQHSRPSISPGKQLEIEGNLTKELPRSISSENLDLKNNCASKCVSSTPSKLPFLPSKPLYGSASEFKSVTDLSETLQPNITFKTPATNGSISLAAKSSNPTSNAFISSDKRGFASSATRTSFSPVIHDLPTKVMHDSPAKRMPSSPTEKMFDWSAKRMHLSPAKRKNILPSESQYIKYPKCILSSSSIDEAEVHSSIIRSQYETEHTSKNEILASQSSSLQPYVNDITWPTYEEHTGTHASSRHPKVTNQAENILQDIPTLNILPGDRLRGTVVCSSVTPALHETEHTSENQKLTSQSTSFQSKVHDFADTSVNYGEQTRTQAHNNHPRLTNQVENTSQGAVPLNCGEGLFIAAGKTSSDTGFSSPGAVSFSSKDSNSPGCPTKLSFTPANLLENLHQFPRGPDVVAHSEDFNNAISTNRSNRILPNLSVDEAQGYLINSRLQHETEYLNQNKMHPSLSHPVGHYESFNGLLTSPTFNVGQASDGMRKKNGLGGSVFSKYETSTKDEPFVSIKYSGDTMVPSASFFKDRSNNCGFHRERESLTEREICSIQSTSNLADKRRAAIASPVDEAQFVVQTSAHQVLISILRRCRSSGYAASGETHMTNELYFINEIRNLLTKLPENVAHECKSFILRFLCQALNTVLEW